jgi:SAM-dependent methyltransferase
LPTAGRLASGRGGLAPRPRPRCQHAPPPRRETWASRRGVPRAGRRGTTSPKGSLRDLLPAAAVAVIGSPREVVGRRGAVRASGRASSSAPRAELWPSSIALAAAVAGQALDGLRVLELGCGLGIPSVVAALDSARALATDWSPDALLAAENGRRNGVEVETALARWDDPDALADLAPWAPWDLVLASDVLYERRNGDELLELLPRLVETTGEVLLADPSVPTPPGSSSASRRAGAPSAWPASSARSSSSFAALRNSLQDEAPCAAGPRRAARCGVLGSARRSADARLLRPCLALAQRTLRRSVSLRRASGARHSRDGRAGRRRRSAARTARAP